MNWWPFAMHYVVLVIAVSLVAWTVGLSLRRAEGAPPIHPARNLAGPAAVR